MKERLPMLSSAEKVKRFGKLLEKPLPHEVVSNLNLMLQKLREGLPRATSAEVLSSRMKW